MSLWCPSSPGHSVAGLGLVLHNCLPHTSPLRNEVNNLLQECLSKILASGSKCPPIGVVNTLSQFLSDISQTHWDNDVSPTLARLTKKSPETSAQLVCAVTGAVGGVDMSALITDSLVTCLPRMLKSSTQPTRLAGQAIARHAAEKCASTGPCVALLMCLLDTLQGKVAGTSLVHNYQKESVLIAIELVVGSWKDRTSALEEGALLEAVNGAVSVLIACMDKEVDHGVRYGGDGCVDVGAM